MFKLVKRILLSILTSIEQITGAICKNLAFIRSLGQGTYLKMQLIYRYK